MSRHFELDVKPLDGYGFNSADLKTAVHRMVCDFYQADTDLRYLGTINDNWFQVSEYPEESQNNIHASFYCKRFLKEEAKTILKKLSIRLAELFPETPFTGEINMTDESNGYSWTYISEYHNRLLSVRGVGMWDYPGNPDTEQHPGCCPGCDELVIGANNYHPDKDPYICPECGAAVPCAGIWWDCNNCRDLSHCEDKDDTRLFCDIDEHIGIVDLKIPEGITYIPFMAFSGCEKLERVSFPSTMLMIDEKAFEGCTSLKEIALPARLEYINSEAFSGCTSLTCVVLPYGIKTIDFMSAFSSLESVTIPDSVTDIGDETFSGCTSLSEIKTGDNSNYCTVNGVLFDKDQTQLICYPAGNRSNTYSILDGVTRIGSRAFKGCNSLTSVIIPDSVTSIGDWAFYNCSNLTSVTIPETVSIGHAAFENTLFKKALYDDPANWEDGILYMGNVLIKANGSLSGEYTIKSGVKGIAGGAFSDFDSLTGIVIPDGVLWIGSYAFDGCRSLMSVTIPSSVTSIGDSAFSGCENLTSITIPDGVTSIGKEAFANCGNLTEITIPGTVTGIGDGAFWCSSLINVTILEGVTSIGEGAFDSCRSLTSIMIPDSVTRIGGGSFGGCDDLTIHAPTGSYAEQYADDNGIPFEAIE